jgi:ectoine hydroxylase-related dioxygenase (phytanoyl-CoA dioxygenase family)
VTVLEEVPHVTGMVSVSGGGVALEPVVIMKSLQHLRELADEEFECYFATSANAEMTKNIWVDSALVFSAQISPSDLSFPKHLHDQDMRLVVDGYKTRISVLVAAICRLNGIDVLRERGQKDTRHFNR